MPTPIGHALGGVIVGLLSRSGATGQSWERRVDGLRQGAGYGRYVRERGLALCAVAACLPDLDFLWGRHNMETHSLGFAVLVGLAVLAGSDRHGLAIACALGVASHVLFDWLGSDDSPPLGVMALWPLSSEFYFANAFVFEAISRRYWLPDFVMHNVLAVVREVAILLPVTAALWWLRRR